jgi:toxin ParE1/3/4
VRKFELSFRPLAEADLFGLYPFIAEQAGYEVARGYIDRLEAACLALETFPRRGTRRDDIRRGLRTMGFERRATIVYQVKRAEVVIVRIFYGGQGLRARIAGSDRRMIGCTSSNSGLSQRCPTERWASSGEPPSSFKCSEPNATGERIMSPCVAGSIRRMIGELCRHVRRSNRGLALSLVKTSG